MTREEAKREMLFAKREVMADSWIDKAYDVAIQALSEPERKKGKWIDGSIPTYAVCSVCAYQERFAYENNYCPNCGADMRGEQP